MRCCVCVAPAGYQGGGTNRSAVMPKEEKETTVYKVFNNAMWFINTDGPMYHFEANFPGVDCNKDGTAG